MRWKSLPPAGLAAQAGVCVSLAFMHFACGSHAASTRGGPITVNLSAATIEAPQDGTPSSLQVTIGRPSGDTNSVSLAVSGLPAGVTADVSSLGAGNSGTVTFTASASLLTIDANTNSASGPAAVSVSPAARMEITLNGYGVAFLKLVP